MSYSFDTMTTPNVSGQISVARIHYNKQDRKKQRQVSFLFTQKNQIQYSWGFIAAKCIGHGDRNYKIGAMYIEFENVASPSDTVTAPTFTRSEGIDYYQDLVLSSDRDFLRVPLNLNPTIGIVSGFEDIFTEDENGNNLTFFSQSQGSTGYHGKTFSNAVNSKVFGVALVATPDFSDATQDVIFARAYYDTSNQVLKETSDQIGISWNIAFDAAI